MHLGSRSTTASHEYMESLLFFGGDPIVLRCFACMHISVKRSMHLQKYIPCATLKQIFGNLLPLANKHLWQPRTFDPVAHKEHALTKNVDTDASVTLTRSLVDPQPYLCVHKD